MSRRKIEFKPQAKLELDEARDWYEQQEPGLGDRFYSYIRFTLRLIQENPKLFQKASNKTQTRRAVVQTFPYLVYYVPIENKVYITSIFNAYRNPDDLIGRI